MARALASASSQYYEIGSLLAGPPFTMSCQFNPVSASVAYTLMAFGTNGGTNRFVMFSGSTSGQITYSVIDGLLNPPTVTGGTTFSAGTWNQAAIVEGAITGDDHRVFLNGGNKATSTTVGVPGGGLNRTNLGCRWSTTRGAFLNGSLAECGIWSVALTDAEIATLGAGYSPLYVRPESLVGYWPMFARATNEEDWRGSNPFVPGGSPTAAAHPSRIIYPSRRRLLTAFTAPPPPTGGFQTLAGPPFSLAGRAGLAG